MDWIISFNDFRLLWESQPSFLITQCLYLIGGLCTLKHAMSNGGRWLALWLIIILNGLEIEIISNFVPDINNFWHSQSPVMLFGKRLPLGIVFIYPCMYYVAMVSASLLKLSRFYESLAVGILTVLIDLPCDYIGVKYLHWTWHDSDPNIFDRNYWVPWVSYVFHFLFSSIICALYYATESTPTKRGFREIKRSASNWKAIILTSTLATPIVFICFGIFYHPLHDFMMIHSQIIFIALFAISTSLVWRASCARDSEASNSSDPKFAFKYIMLYLLLHYSLFFLTPFFWNPKDQISVGLHQPIGSCNTTESVRSLFGQVLHRKKYLCWKNYRQEYFDFHCVPKFSPMAGEVVSWYTICGTPFKNKAEFISVISGITVVAYIVFRTIFCLDLQKQKERKRV